jgi:hypothetical protein
LLTFGAAPEIMDTAGARARLIGERDVMKDLATEAAIYGVVLVAGLVAAVGEAAEASWDVFVKVCVTVLVMWTAHLYAGVVAHLGDERDSAATFRQRLGHATHDALVHSRGMLIASILPLAVLLLGHFGVLTDEQAVWAALWLCVGLLGVLGYAKIAAWARNRWLCLASGAVSAALGVVLILLKLSVH